MNSIIQFKYQFPFPDIRSTDTPLGECVMSVQGHSRARVIPHSEVRESSSYICKFYSFLYKQIFAVSRLTMKLIVYCSISYANNGVMISSASISNGEVLYKQLQLTIPHIYYQLYFTVCILWIYIILCKISLTVIALQNSK